MTIPTSFSGKAQATTLYADVSNVATSFTVTATGTWTETVGSHIGQPLGTSGPFVITLDYGQSTEEKVLCTGITGSGPYTITVATGGRGYDGTSAVGHSAASAYPVVHTYSADIPQQANLGVTNAAAAQATADTATTNAAAAQSTANTAQTNAAAAQTTANGPNLTAAATLVGTNPTFGTAPLVNYTFTAVVNPNSSGYATVTLPYTLPHSIIGMSATMCYNASKTAYIGAIAAVDGTQSSSRNSCKVWLINNGGQVITATGDSFRINITVCGY